MSACGLEQMTESDTLTWLKTHGTAVDSSNLAMSTLNRGQTVVLTGLLAVLLHSHPFYSVMILDALLHASFKE